MASFFPSNPAQNNSYQGKDCVITFLQEAVQGNAVTDTLLERINARLAAQATPNLSMSEAVKDLEGVANEAAIFANNFVWNSATDRFVEEDDVEQNFYQYFKMYTEMPQPQDYSIYAYGTNWAKVMAGSSVIIIPLLILFAFTQKWFISGLSGDSGVKG